MAVDQRLTVDELAATFTVYPSLSGSVAERRRRAARDELRPASGGRAEPRPARPRVE
ncbi:MAG: hypothetical protein U0R64_04430 [Candidatus Nanopelagicales bacterium]